MEKFIYTNRQRNDKMTSKLVTIPKEEYDLLIKCKKIIESDFEEKFSEEFILAVKESEKEYRNGEYLKFKNAEEAKKHFDRD